MFDVLSPKKCIPKIQKYFTILKPIITIILTELLIAKIHNIKEEATHDMENLRKKNE
jgi:hypothetical protein